MSRNHLPKDSSNKSEWSLKAVVLVDCGLLVSVLMFIGLFFKSEIFDYLEIEAGLLQILISIVMWVFGIIGAFVILVIIIALAVELSNRAKRKRSKEEINLYPSSLSTYYPSDSSSKDKQGTDCLACNGTGRILMTNSGYNRNTIPSEYETCDQCNGTGKR